MAATNLHFQVRVISRGAGRSAPAAASYRSGSVVGAGGRSAVASASYRSGETLHDERLDRTFDYTRKEDVLHAEIVAPANAPAWVYDRARLWNGVEAAEKRKDARLARDIIAALPRGLDAAAYQDLAKPSSKVPVTYYSSVEPDLYQSIIQKYDSGMAAMTRAGMAAEEQASGGE